MRGEEVGHVRAASRGCGEGDRGQLRGLACDVYVPEDGFEEAAYKVCELCCCVSTLLLLLCCDYFPLWGVFFLGTYGVEVVDPVAPEGLDLGVGHH